MHTTEPPDSAAATTAEALEITPHNWVILCQRDGHTFPDLHITTGHQGWAALPELDNTLTRLGYTRSTDWVPAAMLGGYATTLQAAA